MCPFGTEITFNRSNYHMPGLLDHFKWSKHQNKYSACLISYWWYSCMSEVIHGLSLWCKFNSVLFNSGTNIILVNITGRNPFGIITHTDESVIYPPATFPPCQSATFTPVRSHTHLPYSSTWELSGRKNKNLSVWRVILLFLWLVSKYSMQLCEGLRKRLR